jgi:CBS domain containing-hemolysin-like protein
MAKILEPFIRIKFNIENEILIVLLQTLIATLIILFTGEFLPKIIFRARPNITLNIFAVPVFILYVLFYPVTVIILGLTNLIMRYIFRIREKLGSGITTPVFGKIDLDHLVSESQLYIEQKSDDEEKKIFQNALEFSKLKVRDCMIPRTEIEALELNSSIEWLRKKFIETGYSKILIYRESIDNIVGYMNSKDMFTHPESLKEKLVQLSIVPETMKVNRLFRKLIKERKTIALVVDEYGGTSGIITLEDIIEEIFGEIEDEHDTIEFIDRQINENEYIFSGRLEIDYINEKYKIGITDSDEYDTLAGFIIFHHENIPKLNTRVIIKPYQFRILKVSQTKIELVHIKKIGEDRNA